MKRTDSIKPKYAPKTQRAPRLPVTAIAYADQTLLAEFCSASIWRLWTSYNADRTHGTSFLLCPDGAIYMDTIEPTGSERRVVIKPPEMKKP